MLHDIWTNEWVILAVRTLVITFATRFVLDIVASPIVRAERPRSIWTTLLGWSFALLMAAYLYGGTIGVLAGLVACVAHTIDMVREGG